VTEASRESGAPSKKPKKDANLHQKRGKGRQGAAEACTEDGPTAPHLHWQPHGYANRQQGLFAFRRQAFVNFITNQ